VIPADQRDKTITISDIAACEPFFERDRLTFSPHHSVQGLGDGFGGIRSTAVLGCISEELVDLPKLLQLTMELSPNGMLVGGQLIPLTINWIALI